MSQFGRSQLFSNAIASVFAYMVAVGIGFIMPRVIYESVGAVALGLWDLGWSFIVYVTFSGIGFGPAIAYFVSRDQAGTGSSTSSTIATGLLCQLAFGGLLTVAFISGFAFISGAVESLGPDEAALVNQIGLLLGLTVGVVIVGDVAHNVLLGFHKARVTEYINIAHDVSLAIGMIIVLALGYGVIGLAYTTLALRFLAECLRAGFALKLCGYFSFSAASIALIPDLTRYAIKSSAAVFQELLVYQVGRLILFFSSGPVALAAFSRYATITRQIIRLVDRVGISLPSIASGLSAEGETSKIRSLCINGAQAGMLITLPLLVTFCVFGDDIVEIWMGPDFVVSNLAWVFAAGALLHANYSICARILSGINAHGRVTLACLFLSGLALFLITSMTYPQTQVESAIMIAFVMLFSVHTPYLYYAARKLSISGMDMARRIYARPVLLNFVFGLVLVLADYLIGSGRFVLGALSAFIGVVTLFCTYWYYALEPKVKAELLDLLNLTHKPAEGAR